MELELIPVPEEKETNHEKLMKLYEKLNIKLDAIILKIKQKGK